MKLSVETISREQDEEVILRCYDENAKWVRDIYAVVIGEHSIVGVRDAKIPPKNSTYFRTRFLENRER